MKNTYKCLTVSVIVIFLCTGCKKGDGNTVVEGGESNATINIAEGLLDSDISVTGLGGISLLLPAKMEVLLDTGEPIDGDMIITVDDGTAIENVVLPVGLQSIAYVQISAKINGVNADTYFLPNQNQIEKTASIGPALLLPEKVLEGFDDSFLLYVLVDESGRILQHVKSCAMFGKSVLVLKEDSLTMATWQYVGQGRGDTETPLQISGPGVYSIAKSSIELPVPQDGFELQYSVPGRAERLKIIDEGTAEVLGVWNFNRTALTKIERNGPKVSGPDNQRFWCWIKRQSAGDKIYIRSAFADRPVLRVVFSKDGKENIIEDTPKGPFVTINNVTGAAIVNPYDDCSLQFAASLQLIATSSYGNFAHLKRNVIQPLREKLNSNTANLISPVILEYYRSSKPIGYYSSIRVQDRRCAATIIEPLLEPYQVNSLRKGRYLQVDYNSFDLQREIDATEEDGTLIVPPGEYVEEHIAIYKKIKIKSVDPLDPAIVDSTVLHWAYSLPIDEEWEHNFGSGLVSFTTCGRETVLEGFTFSNIQGRSAVNIFDAAPTIRNCTFYHNIAPKGSGIFIQGNPTYIDLGADIQKPSALIENCIFMDNKSVAYNIGSWNFGGGAIYVTDYANVEIKSNMFTNNHADMAGGAIFSYSGGNVSIIDNSFDNNSAGKRWDFDGEYDYTGDAGAIYWTSIVNPVISGNIFANNILEYSYQILDGRFCEPAGAVLVLFKGDPVDTEDFSDNIFTNNLPTDIQVYTGNYNYCEVGPMK